jgi:hypothetical protein
VLLVLATIYGCSEDTAADGDTDAGILDGDVTTDADTDTDTDGDSDTDSDTGSTDDTDGILDILILPEGANPADLYGDTPVQIVETDFDTTVVDWTLGGMHSDLPKPRYDCTDPMITKECISYVVDIGNGEVYEYLWVGNEEIHAGASTSPIDGYGIYTSILPPYAAAMDVFVNKWGNTPTTFSEHNLPETSPQTLYIKANFDDFDGGGGGTPGTIFREARINGWAAHTTDYGDPQNTVMVAAFAGEWDPSDASLYTRFKGTFKRYFRTMDIKK